MQQVILNLCINARDAMPKGGHLLIESKRHDLDADAAQLLSLAPGAYVLLTFTDSGCGIEEQARARIFEPFFTTKEPGIGTGLGLSTVLGVVNQSGGAISVHSEINRGTRFKIYLPLVDGSGSAAPPPLPAAIPAGETILVVEDDGGVRGLVRGILEEHGYRVVEAATEEAAFTAAENSPVDLLLTGAMLSGMSGDELADRLVAVHPGMKVLYMPGSAETGSVPLKMREPGLNILMQPFQPRELLRKTGEVLRKQGASAKLLIVDDDAQVRSYLATLLELEGYSVSQASNGKEAETHCRESLPDLVITDLVMPEQEGLETIHIICERWPHLPVIAISGAFGGVYLDLAKKMGADAILQKPFEPDVILNEVRRLTVPISDF